jgi:hypothetical protein
MCDCVPRSQRSLGHLHPAWLSVGEVAHPDAPAGGGGPGLFRQPGAVSTDGGRAMLPHPDSPAATDLDPQRLDAAQGEKDKEVKRLPPPLVTDESTQIIQGMTVILYPDAHGIAGAGSATTQLDESEGGASYDFDKGTGKVTVMRELPWKVEIQTRYGSGTPDDDAAYGRGTTDKDKEDGNITLGFHESCHRADILAYLQQHSPPVLPDLVDKTKVEADAAIATYKTACKAYFQAARKHSETVTDEDGKPKRSEYLAKKKAGTPKK